MVFVAGLIIVCIFLFTSNTKKMVDEFSEEFKKLETQKEYLDKRTYLFNKIK